MRTVKEYLTDKWRRIEDWLFKKYIKLSFFDRFAQRNGQTINYDYCLYLQ